MVHMFDLEERIRQKQQDREQDDADLAAGRISSSELQKRNSFAVGLDLRKAVVIVDQPLD